MSNQAILTSEALKGRNIRLSTTSHIQQYTAYISVPRTYHVPQTYLVL